MLVDGGKENEVFHLFNLAETGLSEDLKNNLNSTKSKTIDSLRINKLRNDLKLIRKYNKAYMSYIKLSTLLRPSLIDLRAVIEEAILSLDNKSFSSNEIDRLRSRFSTYIKEMELKMDENNFPEFSSIAFNPEESFEVIKTKYEYILLDIWAT